MKNKSKHLIIINMGFFARPNLEDMTFKQLAGSCLTLSGETRIATTSGFTLTDGAGGYIPIVVTGASSQNVLTYNSSTCQITLQPPTGSGGAYTGASPTTCTVGGLVAGSSIAGQSISDILETILVPTLYPTIVEPFGSFSISPSGLLYEVGTNVDITGYTTFNQGSITPAYCGGPSVRSAGVCCYNYNAWGNETGVVSSSLCNVFSFCVYPISFGNNTLSSCITYSGGGQPLDSCGGNYNSPLPDGYSPTNSIIICGMYPYYYGKVASCGAAAGVNRPLPTASLITGGTKVVANSTNTICITFNSTNDEYLWFAIPNASTSKTKWYVDALNNGDIGGVVSVGGNLFPNRDTVTGVETVCWTGQTYKLYISNYQSASTSLMQLRNS